MEIGSCFICADLLSGISSLKLTNFFKSLKRALFCPPTPSSGKHLFVRCFVYFFSPPSLHLSLSPFRHSLTIILLRIRPLCKPRLPLSLPKQPPWLLPTPYLGHDGFSFFALTCVIFFEVCVHFISIHTFVLPSQPNLHNTINFSNSFASEFSSELSSKLW